MGLFLLQKREAPPRPLGEVRSGKCYTPGRSQLLTTSKFNDTVQLATLLTEKPRKDHFQVLGLGRGEAEGRRQGSSVTEERSQSVPMLESVVFKDYW